MRTPSPRTRETPTPLEGSGRLRHRRSPRGPEFFSRALGEPPALRGERLLAPDGEVFRHWEPARSKLGAALVLGWKEPIPAPGERWLYLGAGSGTTASHVADLLGPEGAVYAVEPSVRPFLGLIGVADRYPNLLPILGDGRDPESYGGSVPIVDGVYADVAQPDQAEILTANARAFLRPGGAILFVVKTASMGRELRPQDLLQRALERLPRTVRTGEPLALEPFHRRHYLVGGRWGTGEGAPDPITPRPGPRVRPRR